MSERFLKFALTAICVWIPMFSSVEARASQTGFERPNTAQESTASEVESQVYEQLPDLPLENQYISQDTGEVNPNSTLITRLIRYHVYVKGRPPQYRLDWKLTLADYLGVNELMFEGVYPGSENLRDNPMLGDRQAIANLTRSQRNALVHTLVSLYNPQYLQLLQEAATGTSQTPTPPNGEIPRRVTQPPRPPQPGDADLLNP